MYLGVALLSFIILFLVPKSSTARRMASFGFYVFFVPLYSVFQLHTAYDIYSVHDNDGVECA